jgi:hypothetical protein
MPVPASLMATTGLFLVLALLADISPRARPVIVAAAWGLDQEGLLRVLPQGLFAEAQQAQAVEAASVGSAGSSGTTQAPGTTTAAGRG